MQSSSPSFETLRYQVLSSLYRIIQAKQHTAMDAILWQELESYGIDGSSAQNFDGTVKAFTWNTLKRPSAAMEVMRMHFEVAHLAATWMSEIANTTASPPTVRGKIEKLLEGLPGYVDQCEKLLKKENGNDNDTNGNFCVEVPEQCLKVQNPDVFVVGSNNRSFSLRHIVDVVDGKISALVPPDMYVAYFRRVEFSNVTVTSSSTGKPLTNVFERNNSGSLKTNEDLPCCAAAELASWNDNGDVIGRLREDVENDVPAKRNASPSNSPREGGSSKRSRPDSSAIATVQRKNSPPMQMPESEYSIFLDMVRAERESLKSQISRLLLRLGTIDQLVNTNLDLNNANIEQQMDELRKVIENREDPPGDKSPTPEQATP